MMGTPSNESRSPASSGADVEVPAKPKRRCFSITEKARTVRGADACEAGTVGAFLRREGIFLSQLYAWRRERDYGDLDGQTATNRASKRREADALERRSHEVEVEVRNLDRKIARFELIEDIRKKRRGS